MKTRKYKQRGGSKTPYTRREKNQLIRVGFTDEQIRYLNNIKKEYGLESLNVAGIVYLIHENNHMTPDLYTASYDKNIYPTIGDTDNEEDTDDDDDEENQSGGKKRQSRSRLSTKRETRRRRKSIKRRRSARKIYRKTRKFKKLCVKS
jgi:hypothetical protein